MVRISDIFKKAKERKDKEKIREKSPPEPARKNTPPKPVKPEPVEEVVSPETKAYEEKKTRVEDQKKEKPEISGVRISSLMMKGTKVASGKETLGLYEETISLMREILKEDVDYESVDIKRITAQVEKIIDQLILGNEKMLMLAFIKDSRNKNYLFCHSVNVCIFSIEVGLGLGYEKSRLMDLGISALLYDIGMVNYMHLAERAKELTKKEYNQVQNHTVKGSEILEKIKGLAKVALYVAHQQHERIDGSGYPRGLKKESINVYARIVGLVDVYEAMTHIRTYRNEFLPSEVIQEILNNKKGFENKLIKILIERVGIYPVGSLVELNTKEKAQVIKLNSEVPLRPLVKIICETNGEEAKETKIIDLKTLPTIYIKKGLSKETLETLSRQIEEWKD